MNGEEKCTTWTAGTSEKSDCVVSLSESDHFEYEFEGSNIERFIPCIKEAMTKRLEKLKARPVKVKLVSDGATDIVICARLEAAYKRYEGGEAR